jgi:very-short-patch-repair endonuclease
LDKEAVLVVEVDGFEYHQNNEKQLIRDKMKDNILKCVGIPTLRFATNGSEESKKLIAALRDVVRESGEGNE